MEAPEYLSSGFTALVFLSGRREAVVPVHGRYHRPSDSSKRVKVELESPRLLLRSEQCETLQTLSLNESSLVRLSSEPAVFLCFSQSQVNAA